MSEMTAAELIALKDNNEMWNNPFIYLIWMSMFRNGNGWGGDSAAQGAMTRAELYDGLNFQTLDGAMRDMQTNLCSGFSGVQMAITQQGNANQMAVTQQGFALQSAIAQASFEAQKCCCETNRNIDAVRFENAQNTCAITTAIHAEGEATRALFTANEIQKLRDSREAVQRELQSAQLQLGNISQTQTILNRLGHFVPYANAGVGCGGGCFGAASGWY